jgi:hypothetical protein
MGEVRGFGITHYPPLSGTDESMAYILENTLRDPRIPDSEKDPARWPPAMQAEWADEAKAAASHRADLVSSLDTVREAIDEFAPELVVIWGDDQYELFREEVVPPFCVLALEDTTARPFATRSSPNVWGEGAEREVTVHMSRAIGRHYATELLRAGFDIAYAYKARDGSPFPHAFLNALLYLDYHRDKGFPYTILPISVNCYGSKVISARGGMSSWQRDMLDPSKANADTALDPPSPSPHRCMQLGAAVARIALESPYRVALLASSGWSHAFLTDKTWRLRPDVGADRRLYDALVSHDLAAWHQYQTEELEEAGQHEMLNWFCLLGAVEELGQKPRWTEFLESHIFNSSKVFAIFE